MSVGPGLPLEQVREFVFAQCQLPRVDLEEIASEQQSGQRPGRPVAACHPPADLCRRMLQQTSEQGFDRTVV
ncbi:hypothetical protein D3C78_842170 [compost metagenome]